MAVSIKTPQDIAILRECGKRLAAVLRRAADAARPGVSAQDLDMLAERLIREQGGEPVFKGYRMPDAALPFPATLCVSINDEVVHGIPRLGKILRDGDIVGLDIGMRWNGLVTDTAITIGIGRISADPSRLVHATRQALDIGVAAVKSGSHVGDISHAIESHLKKINLGIIRDLGGHGVGYRLHEEPLIPNYGKSGTGPELCEGMVIAIEPMATLGGWRVALDDDEWTFRTADGSLAAHFEHTIAVAKDGAEVLTR